MNRYFNTDARASDLKERTVKGAGATVFLRFLTYGIQTVSTIVLARLLTPDQFGVFAMVSVVAMIVVEFGMLRFTDAVVQAKQISHAQVSTLFWISVVLCCFLALLFAAMAPVIADFYRDSRIVPIAMALSIGFVFSGLSVQHTALMQRNMEFLRVGMIQVVAICVGGAIGIVMAFIGFGYWALVGKYLTNSASIAVGSWVLCGWRPGWPARASGVGPLVNFGVNSLGNYILNYACRSLDKILVGWRYDAASLGCYDRAYHLFVLPVNQISYPLTGVAVAALSRIREDRERFCRYYLQATSIIAFVGMPLGAMVTLMSDDIIRLLLGQQWAGAADILRLFGLGVGVMLVYGTHGWLHLSLGRADRWLRWGVVQVVTTVILFFVGVGFGASGVAVAYTCSFYVLTLPGLWYGGRPVGLKIVSVLAAIWRFYVSAALAGICCWWMLEKLWGRGHTVSGWEAACRLAIEVGIFVPVYLASVVLISGNVSPIVEFWSLVRQMLSRSRAQAS